MLRNEEERLPGTGTAGGTAGRYAAGAGKRNCRTRDGPDMRQKENREVRDGEFVALGGRQGSGHRRVGRDGSAATVALALLTDVVTQHGAQDEVLLGREAMEGFVSKGGDDAQAGFVAKVEVHLPTVHGLLQPTDSLAVQAVAQQSGTGGASGAEHQGAHALAVLVDLVQEELQRTEAGEVVGAHGSGLLSDEFAPAGQAAFGQFGGRLVDSQAHEAAVAAYVRVRHVVVRRLESADKRAAHRLERVVNLTQRAAERVGIGRAVAAAEEAHALAREVGGLQGVEKVVPVVLQVAAAPRGGAQQQHVVGRRGVGRRAAHVVNVRFGHAQCGGHIGSNGLRSARRTAIENSDFHKSILYFVSNASGARALVLRRGRPPDCKGTTFGGPAQYPNRVIFHTHLFTIYLISIFYFEKE